MNASIAKRYARYTRLKFDTPHPRVLRITMDATRRRFELHLCCETRLSSVDVARP